ncbi:hypothetical protein [Natrinema salaciae]|uniref:VCBS repeat-containing protein n=1 Tax=Natrinema salaciae TaxID=1186196 RepID=A0A1H9JDG4_9EURY|nr:hypothetical protein [Natrinema salaciae]SEQ85041.1 hypothetical protein SAMN04489841_2519 [Natrinema salaciae]
MDETRHDPSKRTESTTDAGIGRRRVLRASAGTAAAALGIAAVSGQAAAHFPTDLEIEVKPGCEDEEAPINPGSEGVIPVAVLQTAEFDPTTKDVRYRFGAPDAVADGGGARPDHDGFVVDVTGDGRDDLLLFFPTAETGFDGDDSSARLEWERSEDGEHGLAGTAPIRIVGRCGR